MPTLADVVKKKKEPAPTIPAPAGFTPINPQIPPPAANTPNIAPPPDTSTKTIFNPDNTITKITGGVPVNISRREYEADMANRVRQARVDDFNRRYPESITETAAKIPTKTYPTIEEMNKVVPMKPEYAGGLEQLKRAVETTPAFTKERAEAVAPAFAQSAAEIIDNFRSALSTKAPKRVQKAIEMFTDVSAMTDSDIELVRQGVKTSDEVWRNFEAQFEAVRMLEATTKGLGQANTDFWVNQGKSTEAQVKKEYAIMERQRQQLIDADREAQLNRALISQNRKLAVQTTNKNMNAEEVQQ